MRKLALLLVLTIVVRAGVSTPEIATVPLAFLWFGGFLVWLAKMPRGTI